MFEKSIYINRRKALKNKINSGIGLFLGNNESPMNYTDNTYRFRQDSTFWYFFGINLPSLAAVIDFESGEEIIFGDDIDIEDIIWMGNHPSMSELASQVGISKTKPLANLSTFLTSCIAAGRFIHYLPPYRADHKLYLEHVLGIHSEEQKKYSSLGFIKAIIDLRSVKSHEEITAIEEACAIGYEMHVTAMKMAVNGKTEQNIVSAIEAIPSKYGGALSFPIILSQNGQILHNHDHSLKLQPGRLLIVDAGAENAMGYASDFTRTLSVGGKYSTKQREIYQVVLAANNAATAMAKPGITYQQVHLHCAKVIASGLKDLGLMTGNVDEAVAAGAHAFFFPHGLGHMMGLDVHDMENLGQMYVGYDEVTRPIDQFGTAYLRMGRRLEPGFVITNEPGIYFIPELYEKWKKEGRHTGFINYDKVKEYLDFGGIRLEDDILITEGGARVLGTRVPIEMDEIEALASK